MNVNSMSSPMESYQRAVEQIRSRDLLLDSSDFNQWNLVSLKNGTLDQQGLRIVTQGPSTDSTALFCTKALQTQGGQVTIHSGGKGNIVLLAGGNTQRTPHVTLNLFSNQAVVYLNLDHMAPILQRPLTLQVTFYNGPNQLFYWGAGSSSVHCVSVLDGRDRTIAIKDDVMISNDVYLRNHDGHSIVDLTDNSLCNPGGNIVIENHVWVGQDVLCLGPCHIGSGSVVAAKSLAKGDIPTKVIAGGVPARIIKENASWSRVPNSLEFFNQEFQRVQ
jgi:carbonic anhydrase/acetyltransferase-like protein (isoleucine patch superfamily)